MINDNDSKLTAFVLGELSPEELREIEQAIADSPELRAEVDAIRETASLLEDGFAVQGESELQVETSKVARPPAKAKRTTRERLLAIAASAACLAIVFGGFYFASRFSTQIALVKPGSLPAEFQTKEEQLQEMIAKFNTLVEQGQLAEAEIVARAAYDLAPETDFATAMMWKATFMRRHAQALDTSSKEHSFLDVMAPVDTSSPSGSEIVGPIQQQESMLKEATDTSSWDELAQLQIDIPDAPEAPPIVYPSSEFWEKLTKQRSHYKAVELLTGEMDESESAEEHFGDSYSESSVEFVEQSYTVQVPQTSTRTLTYTVNVPYTEEVDGKLVTRTRIETRTREVPVTTMQTETRTRSVRVPRSGKTKNKQTKPKSWKRVKAIPNTSRLMVGDKDELPMQGMQVRVKADGFRARVLLDCMYYNDRDQQLEGSFKLRLPADASLYYFAFGESSYQYQPDLKQDDLQEKLIRREFEKRKQIQQVSFVMSDIRKDRGNEWLNVKEARVVPKEKAAFAYGQTVRRRVDPALVEWAGAGVFNAKVFPLVPHKMHRIVIGYDVNLQLVDGKLVYQLDLPKESGACSIDLDFATREVRAVSGESEQQHTPDSDDDRTRISLLNPTQKHLEFVLDLPEQLALISSDDAADRYFAMQVTPDLPSDAATGSSQAVFMVDTSLSSNADKFNVWLKMLRATLDANRDSMQRFAVLFFDVDQHWWQERFVENSAENVDKLLEYCEILSLEGATDLHSAFTAVSRAEWIDGKSSPDLFLLSDAAATWGETNLAQVSRQLKQSSVGSLFAYQTGMTGTDLRALRALAGNSGGAVFQITNEMEIATAATAHRNRPWQLKGIDAGAATDVLTAGRADTIYPGQTLLISGRGTPEKEIVLECVRGDEAKESRIPISQQIESELAERIYGEIAVGQLESLGRFTEDVSVAYARHFRVPGQTCSLLMLDSEADYQRFNIKPEDDRFVVNSSKASSLIEKKLATIRDQLADPKAELFSWLERLEKAESLKFKLPTALRIAIEDLPPAVFDVGSRKVDVRKRTVRKIDERTELLKQAESYDAIQKLAQARRSEFGTGDALRSLSNLVEQSPGNLVLARDIAFTAMQWDAPDAAYFLLRRVATTRPYEGHVYSALARCLAQLGQTELAIVFYEVAINGEFASGGPDFRRIATVEYVSMLKDIVEGRRMTAIPEYARSKYESLKSRVGFEKADLVVSMMWNTDRTDVDLHVVEPGGEECYYQHRKTKMGGQITSDVTTGYGPEMYALQTARPGQFTIKAKYFGGDALQSGVRAKVLLSIYEKYGTDEQTERREVVTLEKTGEVIEVATVKIAQGKTSQ